MSQSPRVDLALDVWKCAKKGDGSRPWVCCTARGCGILRVGGGGLNSALLDELRARWCRRKECRIFFLKCHVVKLWRVLYYFQEERLNFLPLDFPPPCLPPVSTPLSAAPVALRAVCHWMATKDSESVRLHTCLLMCEIQRCASAGWRSGARTKVIQLGTGLSISCVTRRWL